jgi:hypothetical protein
MDTILRDVLKNRHNTLKLTFQESIIIGYKDEKGVKLSEPVDFFSRNYPV